MRSRTDMPRRRHEESNAGEAVVALLLLPIHAVVSGLIVRYLYHRLLAPTFPMLPQHISVAEALGLSIFVGYLTADDASTANDKRSLFEREFTYVIQRLLILLLALVVGWFM